MNINIVQLKTLLRSNIEVLSNYNDEISIQFNQAFDNTLNHLNLHNINDCIKYIIYLEETWDTLKPDIHIIKLSNITNRKERINKIYEI